MQKFIVSKDPAIYEAWPDVCRCDNDRLICVFSECTHHVNRELARVTYVISDNRGRTWGEKHYLTEPGKRNSFFNCARISRLADGTLVIVCDLISDGDENGRNVQVFLWFSRDNGETWSEPVKTAASGIVPERLTELSCGRWLLAAHTMNPETGKLCQYLWYSDDRGQTWSDRVTVADDPRYNLCEAGLLVVDDDTIVCFMRENSMQGWDGFKAISHDRGETWEGVYNVPLPGCHRPTVGWLADGNVLVTYRFLQGGSGFFGAYQNVMGALIDRASVLETVRNRQTARIFPLSYDRNLHSDCGYTGWVQFVDGEILIVNYLKDDAPKAWIEAISLRPDELLIVN
ncbi:MAG: exo-alpha-sialidase [Clostridia bacterium]|nr:exo-alpha-sialidase [Clostridia bacterium]